MRTLNTIEWGGGGGGRAPPTSAWTPRTHAHRQKSNGLLDPAICGHFLSGCASIAISFKDFVLWIEVTV